MATYTEKSIQGQAFSDIGHIFKSISALKESQAVDSVLYPYEGLVQRVRNFWKTAPHIDLGEVKTILAEDYALENLSTGIGALKKAKVKIDIDEKPVSELSMREIVAEIFGHNQGLIAEFTLKLCPRQIFECPTVPDAKEEVQDLAKLQNDHEGKNRQISSDDPEVQDKLALLVTKKQDTDGSFYEVSSKAMVEEKQPAVTWLNKKIAKAMYDAMIRVQGEDILDRGFVITEQDIEFFTKIAIKHDGFGHKKTAIMPEIEEHCYGDKNLAKQLFRAGRHFSSYFQENCKRESLFTGRQYSPEQDSGQPLTPMRLKRVDAYQFDAITKEMRALNRTSNQADTKDSDSIGKAKVEIEKPEQPQINQSQDLKRRKEMEDNILAKGEKLILKSRYLQMKDIYQSKIIGAQEAIKKSSIDQDRLDSGSVDSLQNDIERFRVGDENCQSGIELLDLQCRNLTLQNTLLQKLIEGADEEETKLYKGSLSELRRAYDSLEQELKEIDQFEAQVQNVEESNDQDLERELNVIKLIKELQKHKNSDRTSLSQEHEELKNQETFCQGEINKIREPLANFDKLIAATDPKSDECLEREGLGKSRSPHHDSGQAGRASPASSLTPVDAGSVIGHVEKGSAGAPIIVQNTII